MADRIQARAIARAGAILKEIEKAQGKHWENKRDGTVPFTRTSAANDAGLSERQRKTALRVANIPEQEFEDKRRCVQIALHEFSDWSDRKIAEVCGVSNDFTSRIHKEQVSLKDTCSVSAHSEPTIRTGRDGKRYPVPARVGTMPATRLAV